MSDLWEKEFVIFDVETTGLSHRGGDRIVEIAALKVKGFKPIAEFESLINPGRPISYQATQVNGITNEMLCGAPEPENVIKDFTNFAQGSCLVGHNVKFDLGFLYNELDLLDVVPDEDVEVIDTLTMARKVLPGLGRYPLWFVAQSLGIDIVQEHRAMSDVKLTYLVFTRLVEKASMHEDFSIGNFVR